MANTSGKGKGIGWSALLVFLGAGSTTAMGAGFYFQEVGTPYSVGTAGVANVTNTHGADAAWSNPAGMVWMNRHQLLAGLQVVVPKIEFESSRAQAAGGDGGNAGVTVLIPSFHYINAYSDRLAFGFSASGTMGGGVDYGKNFVGRYSSVRTELGALGLSPSLSWKVNDQFSIGGGVTVLYTVMEQDIAINPERVPTVEGRDGMLKIEEADGWDYQLFFSANWWLRKDLLVSLLYRSEVDTSISGDVKIERVLLPVKANSVDLDWTAPQWIEVGMKYDYSPESTLYLNAGWQQWSKFSKNVLAFSGGLLDPVVKLDRNWQDTWQAGIAWSHLIGKGAISMGLSYESSPVEDKYRTFDMPLDRIVKISGSYSWKDINKLDYSLGATLYLGGDAPISQTSQGVTTEGDFDSNAVLFISGTLRYRF